MGALMLLDMDENEGFAFGGGELPMLNSTPSPVKGRNVQGTALVARDSIPLFVRDSYAPNETLERQSLTDIVPFSKRRLQQSQLQPMSPLVEDTSEPMQVSPVPMKASTNRVASPVPKPQSPLPRSHTPAASGSSGGAGAGTSPPIPQHAAALHQAKPHSGGGAPDTHDQKYTTPGVNKQAAAPTSSLKGSATSARPAKATPGPVARKTGSGGGAAQATPNRNRGTMSSRTAGTFKSSAPPKSTPGGSTFAAPPAFGSPALLLEPTNPSKAFSPFPSQVKQAPNSQLTPQLLAKQKTPGGGPAVARSLALGAKAPPPGTPEVRQPGNGLAASTLPAALDTPGSVQGVMPYAPASWSTPMARMAALPMEAALHAPLLDSSPFTMDGDDWGGETMCFAEEAKKLMDALAGELDNQASMLTLCLPHAERMLTCPHAYLMLDALEGSSATPMPPVAMSQLTPGNKVAVSPSSVQMMEMQIQMLVTRLAAAEEKFSASEKTVEQLRDQIHTMQFEKSMTMNEGDSDLEREARLCAEELLAVAKVQNSALESEVRSQSRALAESHSAVSALTQEKAAWAKEKKDLETALYKAKAEADSMAAHADSLEARLMTKEGNCADLSTQISAQERQSIELKKALAAKEAECSAAQKSGAAANVQLQKALESWTATQVQNSKQNTEEAHKLAVTAATLTRVQCERDSLSKRLAELSTQADGQTTQLKEKLAASKKENGELLAMCHQLLEQVERAKVKSVP
eukprot:gene20972-27828_t